MDEKAYQLVASVFKDYFLSGDVDNYDAESGVEIDTLRMFAEDLSGAFRSYPNFDKDKFIKACGFPKEEVQTDV